MRCEDHGKPYQFVCKSMGCNYPLLCSECRKNHLMSSKSSRESHTMEIISIRRAFEEAEANLNSNKESLKQLIEPFQKESEMFQKIRFQKEKLIAERDSIIAKIKEAFNKEIMELENSNRQIMLKNKELIPFEQINNKIAHINELEKSYMNDPQKLRESLSYSQEIYMNYLRKNFKVFSSMSLQINEYYIYDDDLRHDFYLSKLELKKKTINSKLLKKMHNQSKLYFLIDDYDYGKQLHYFSPNENVLRIYDIETEKWKVISAAHQLPSFGATIYDPKSERFYLVGGQIQGRKCNTVIWYHRITGWSGETVLKVPRSSAMVTLLDSGKQGHDLLCIAGGIGENKKHLKHCELFDPFKNKVSELPPMNFAVSSGALVTFNRQVVFRIGGLGELKPQLASICEIPQKFDFGEFLNNSSQQWSYVDIEAVNKEITNKFRLFYANQAAIQINPNEILIFGGWSHENIGVNQSYILEVESITNPKGKKSYRYYARWINEKPLVSGEGFADLRPIIYKKRVISLQNISYGQSQVLEKEKKLIEFDMFDWYETENIVDV